MKENFKPKEKILITDASSGIGKVLAIKMAREGYELILHASKQESLDRLILQLPLSCRYDILIADFTSEESVLEFLNTLKKQHKDISSIISNAKIEVNKSLTRKFLFEVNDMLSANLKAANPSLMPIYTPIYNL